MHEPLFLQGVKPIINNDEFKTCTIIKKLECDLHSSFFTTAHLTKRKTQI